MQHQYILASSIDQKTTYSSIAIYGFIFPRIPKLLAILGDHKHKLPHYKVVVDAGTKTCISPHCCSFRDDDEYPLDIPGLRKPWGLYPGIMGQTPRKEGIDLTVCDIHQIIKEILQQFLDSL